MSIDVYSKKTKPQKQRERERERKTEKESEEDKNEFIWEEKQYIIMIRIIF